MFLAACKRTRDLLRVLQIFDSWMIHRRSWVLLDAVVPIVSFGLVDGTPLYLISLLLALGLLTKAIQVNLMPR